MEYLQLISTRINEFLSDHRANSNLIAMGLLAINTLVLWSLLRRLLTSGLPTLAEWTGVKLVGNAGKYTARQMALLLDWIAFVVLVGILCLGSAYHFAGGHIQKDVQDWYHQLTVDEVWRLGKMLGMYLGLALLARFGLVVIRRACPMFERGMTARFGKMIEEENLSIVPSNGNKIQGWFRLWERYLVSILILWSLAAAFWIAGPDTYATTIPTISFLARVLTIIVLARLLTKAVRALLGPLVRFGDSKFGNTRFAHYWEGLTHIVPLGERCLEAAITITAAGFCVQEMQFIAFVSQFGEKIVQCIGIFFVTRVLIEFVHVLLNEAFGLYKPDSPTSQKGKTIVPLIQSVARYVLYFGSLMMMMEKMSIDTKPLLAGAGILGLAVGLGSQSLVSDVVQGLFILFENQYLVGDFVEIGGARGIVEVLSVRHTQIRDELGKLYIIPNGSIKEVINYSKGYVNAVVDIAVPFSDDIERVARAMGEAGAELRQIHRQDVLAETRVEGLVSLTMSEMTLRAVTRVRAGTHQTMQNEYRRLLHRALARSSMGERSAA